MSRSRGGGGSRSSSSRSSNVDRPAGSGGRSVEINGRTVTDPKQVERIERNREASARYAVDAYRSEGTPIPPHLRETVNNQIARGDYSSGGGSRTAVSGTPTSPARQALPFLGDTRTFNQAMREARSALGPNQRFEYGGQTFSTTYGRDDNGDGRISFGEKMRDMTDRGGPGNSGGAFIGGGILSTIGNLATGQFGYDSDGDGRISIAERTADMRDGGGAGRAGARFVGGGTFGALGNMLGGPSAFRGGSTVGGGLGVPGGGGNMGGGGGSSLELVASPPLAAQPEVVPNAPVVDPNAPVSMGFLPPNLAMLLPGDVSAMPQTMYTFEDYLAQLNRQGGGVMPPAIQSLAGQPVATSPLMASVPQGIMSLPPAGLMG
jgi:hypothetical protein